MSQRAILYLEDDQDLCNLLCRLAEKAGVRSVAVHSFDQLVDKKSEALGCQVAFLDIDFGLCAPSGIEACQWLRQHGFLGSIFFLTGYGASHPLVLRAMQIADAEVLSKPIPPLRLLHLIRGEEHVQ